MSDNEFEESDFLDPEGYVDDISDAGKYRMKFRIMVLLSIAWITSQIRNISVLIDCA